MDTRRWYVAPLALACALLAAVAAWLAWSAAPQASGVEPRVSWTDYDWEELARIADELSSCADERDAIARAARYGLCGTDGSIDPARSKELLLADGTPARVLLAGIRHDERTDGGRAGLTFLLAAPRRTHAANLSFEDASGDHADSTGGWAASDLRLWLEGDLWYELPAELRGVVVRVQKRTASGVDAQDERAEAGRLLGTGSDWVGETSDRLWAFSVAELCGTVPVREDLGTDETMCAVYEAEGSRYRLFADTGVEAFEPSGLLAGLGEGSTFWLRTKTLEFGDGFWLVGTDGTPLNGLGEDVRVVRDPSFAPEELWGPDHARGVLVGFCL